MEAVTRVLSLRECLVGRVDLSVHKDGTIRENFSKNKLKEKEFLLFRILDIDMKVNGKEIFLMVEVNKLGLNLVY